MVVELKERFLTFFNKNLGSSQRYTQYTSLSIKKAFTLGDHCTSLENLFFLNCAVGDLTKVRMAKSAREGPFWHLTLDVLRLCSRAFLQENGLVH